MNRAVRYHADANTEIAEAFAYLSVDSPQAAHRFIRRLAAFGEIVAERPFLYRVVDDPIRIARLRPFRYGVYYLVDDDTVTILACLHGSRDPNAIRGILTSRTQPQ